MSPVLDEGDVAGLVESSDEDDDRPSVGNGLSPMSASLSDRISLPRLSVHSRSPEVPQLGTFVLGISMPLPCPDWDHDLVPDVSDPVPNPSSDERVSGHMLSIPVSLLLSTVLLGSV